ncbi:hypothetical protein CEXT_404751 [Caerostris extrusa]|uniref:Uncharacterized protein n=1 Tax=Caerostris extrusa TaxID=172846 RepID=A0AAV4SSX5_CAEEX|nr:hypothetical protein CEXT_404751 [Caerostris extrusa]
MLREPNERSNPLCLPQARSWPAKNSQWEMVLNVGSSLFPWGSSSTVYPGRSAGVPRFCYIDMRMMTSEFALEGDSN